MKKRKGLGIAGLARSGKDTLGLAVEEILGDPSLNLAPSKDKALRMNFASQIKSSIDGFMRENLKLSAYEVTSENKAIIRPLLVAYGECMKTKWGKMIWCEKLKRQIESALEVDQIPIITDVRFDFEAQWLKDEFGFDIIHISKQGNLPPNEIEKDNDPKVAELADILYEWPDFSASSLDCEIEDFSKDHASIILQILGWI
jgi:hypothetical protein